MNGRLNPKTPSRKATRRARGKKDERVGGDEERRRVGTASPGQEEERVCVVVATEIIVGLD